MDIREKLVDRIDKNHDGKLSFTEFAQWFQTKCEQIQRFRTQDAHQKEMNVPPVYELTPALVRAKKFFDKYDKDGSGLLMMDLC